MIRFIRLIIILRPWIVRILGRSHILLVLLVPLLVGCEDEEAARREREHVKAMQKQVTEATRELVSADANARKGWVDAQQSFENTRSSIVKQQSDVQSGLDRLETERKSIATERVTDVLMSGTIEAVGTIVACLVPLLLLGWLMQRVWQNDSVPELDVVTVEPPVSSFQVLCDAASDEANSDSFQSLESHRRFISHADSEQQARNM